jgi:hypothetical protein
MRNYTNEQLLPLPPHRPVALTVESEERLVMEIIIQPALVPGTGSAPPGPPTAFPVPGSTRDDLVDATWEDAEWR